MESSAEIPVVEGLFIWSGSSASLIGSRCDGCGVHYFPKSLHCRNPFCNKPQLKEVLIKGPGQLRSFTRQHFRPPALFRMDNWEPYTIGQVEFPEGVRVMGMLTGFDPAELKIGEKVQLTVEELYCNDAGQSVMTYKFCPEHIGEKAR